LDTSGTIGLWPIDAGSDELARTLDRPDTLVEPVGLQYSPEGRWIALHGVNSDGSPTVWLRDLDAPLDANSAELRRSDGGYANHGQIAFHPSGDWLLTSNLYSAEFWPLVQRYPRVLNHGKKVRDVAFTPDGRWLLSVTFGAGGRDRLVAWPLDGQNGGRYRVLHEEPSIGFFSANLAVHPSGEVAAVGSQVGGRVLVVPITGGPAREFISTGQLSPGGDNFLLSFSPDGRFLAAVPWKAGGSIDVWNLNTGEARAYGPVGELSSSLRFIDGNRLLWTGSVFDDDAVRIEEMIFNLVTGTAADQRSSRGVQEVIGLEAARIVSPGGSLMLTGHLAGGVENFDFETVITNIETGSAQRLVSHGEDPAAFAFDPSGGWMVTGGFRDGLVRVGPVTGGEPHLLIGHEGWVQSVEVSPDGRWIASAGDDGTVRLWPMPDMTKPPLHTLPHDELIAKLKTLTNLRAVRVEESTTGWKIEVGEFPGWETVPSW
jgi:WD40 repeat protein